jgi:hypothetical protein
MENQPGTVPCGDPKCAICGLIAGLKAGQVSDGPRPPIMFMPFGSAPGSQEPLPEGEAQGQEAPMPPEWVSGLDHLMDEFESDLTTIHEREGTRPVALCSFALLSDGSVVVHSNGDAAKLKDIAMAKLALAEKATQEVASILVSEALKLDPMLGAKLIQNSLAGVTRKR